MFEELRKIGRLEPTDYRRTFNLGIGMILVVGKRNLAKARAIIGGAGETCFQIGEVVESRGPRVVYVGGGD
jgi:phosphoribosylformylglycinamidine cyclo-ligase